jgi:tetratricopeptide (TPR) repeat protein
VGVWKLWPCLYNKSPQFNYLFIQKNGDPLTLINGEGIQLKPEDKIKIIDISTNICFNRGVRLVSKDFDVAALLYEETSLAALILERDIFNRYEFQLMIKYYNQDLGHIDVIIEPTVEDWLNKVDRTIGDQRKVEVLERALRLEPKDPRIRDRLIQGYISLKKWDRAARLLEKKAKEDPNPEVISDLLDLYQTMSKSRDIISTLKRLVKLSPKDAEVRYRLASYLEKTGRFKEAIKEYENLLKMVGKADQLSFHKTLGFLYAKRDDSKKAIEHYLSALELDDKDENLYYNVSSLYEKIGQKDKADFYLAKAVALQTGDVDNRIKLAQRLIDKGQLNEAERYLLQVLEKQPKSLPALQLMLLISEKKDDKGAIKKYYEAILSLDPQNTAITYNLGVLEYEAGNLEKALSYFKAFIEKNPNDKGVHDFLFDIYFRQDNQDDAYKEARILVESKPREIGYYRFIFNYLNSRDSFEDLITVLRDGLRANPENMELKEYLVVIYQKTGQDDMAVHFIKEILKTRSNDVPLLLQAARLEEKLGRKKEALGFYKKVIEVSPGHEEAEGAYLRLRLEILPLEKNS